MGPRARGSFESESSSSERQTSSEVDRLPLVLTVQEAASLLRIGRNQAYELVRAGKLGAIRCGRTWRVPRQALIAYLGNETG